MNNGRHYPSRRATKRAPRAAKPYYPPAVPTRPLVLQWSILSALSAGLGIALQATGLQAGILVGPMLAAIVLALRGTHLVVPGRLFCMAQGIIACVIASSLDHAVLTVVAQNAVPMAITVILTLACAVATGWLLLRSPNLPGSAGAWGSMPGAASAMVIMASEFGGDPRIVAVMQYLRVLIVILTASLVSSLVLHHAPPASASEAAAAATPGIGDTAVMVGIAVVGSLLGHRLRLPAGSLLIPMILAACAQLGGIANMHVPYALSALAFAVIGWSVGLRFRRELLKPLRRAVPAMMSGILGLIVLCAGVAWLLTLMAPVSMMTAYLATSPGGIDAVVALSIGTEVDLPFVAAYQSLRLFTVILIGPILGKWLSRLA